MYKKWLLLIGLFILVRLFTFGTFWQASQAKGGWQNFYNLAQPAPKVLLADWHEKCDWHPPLYYFFTTLSLKVFQTQWAIYFFQIMLAWLTVWLSYRIGRLFFSEKIAYFSALLVGIEPYWAWHNFLLVSENLFAPLLLAGLYYSFRYFREGRSLFFYYSFLFLGLATLTRSNTLIFALLLGLAIFLVYLARKYFVGMAPEFNCKKIIKDSIIGTFIFLVVITPWMFRNYQVYGRFTLANMLATNMFFYNLPPLISLQKNISYQAAYDEIVAGSVQALGDPVGDHGDCTRFSREEFIRQLDFYSQEAKTVLMGNLADYSKIHLLKAVPFYFQSGYFDMVMAYSADPVSKPDFTALILKRDPGDIFAFFGQITFGTVIYVLGTMFWGICSLFMLMSLIYSFLRDREKFLFFTFAFLFTLYNALLISPFVLARYRLPINILYFIPLVYIINLIYLKYYGKLKK